NIGARIELVELHPLSGNTIDVRRANLCLSIAAAMPAPQVVGHDEDDVRRARSLGAGLLGETAEQRHEQKGETTNHTNDTNQARTTVRLGSPDSAPYWVLSTKYPIYS